MFAICKYALRKEIHIKKDVSVFYFFHFVRKLKVDYLAL
jgi:hypothetical protein